MRRRSLEGLPRELRAAYFQTYAGMAGCDTEGWILVADRAQELFPTMPAQELRDAYHRAPGVHNCVNPEYWQRVADRAVELLTAGAVGVRLTTPVVKELEELDTAWKLFSVWVPGRSQAQGSKVKTRWGMREDNAELGPWRERVALAAHAEMLKHRLAPAAKVEPLRVTLEFIRPRPKSMPKSYTKPCVTMPDLDKQVRAIFDALTHVLYPDDAQIVSVTAEKRFAEIDEPPGVNIAVERIP